MSTAARIIGALFVTAATIAPAAAQSDGPVTRADISTQLDQRFARIDLNKNGSFDKAEFAAAQKQAEQQIAARIAEKLAAEFSSLDSNKDGSLNPAELAAIRPAGQSGPDTATLFKTIDADANGKISKAEYLGLQARVHATADPAAQIKKFDVNGDGKVTLTEFKSGPLTAFDAADLNKDGVVSVEEQDKARALRGR
ncbi:MAG: EF-hand domain-containing protein [Sphingomicrobium sp.]